MPDHKWFLCPMCGPAVICGTCGNNTCGGGSGTLPNGDPCSDCDSAYEMCHAFYQSEVGQLFGKHVADLTSRWCSERNYRQDMEMKLGERHPEVLADVIAHLDEPKPVDPCNPFPVIDFNN